MSAKNLGLIFGQTLIYTPNIPMMFQMMNMAFVAVVLVYLYQHPSDDYVVVQSLVFETVSSHMFAFCIHLVYYYCCCCHYNDDDDDYRIIVVHRFVVQYR